MTTRLAGQHTRFLPFNRGNDGGIGNPPNPLGNALSYFWEETPQRDVWPELIGSFMHMQVEVEVDPDTGKNDGTEKLPFPRYHQWRAVARLVEALVQYVRLHPTHISQKAKIVVDHFRSLVRSNPSLNPTETRKSSYFDFCELGWLNGDLGKVATTRQTSSHLPAGGVCQE